MKFCNQYNSVSSQTDVVFERHIWLQSRPSQNGAEEVNERPSAGYHLPQIKESSSPSSAHPDCAPQPFARALLRENGVMIHCIGLPFLCSTLDADAAYNFPGANCVDGMLC